MLYKPDAAPDCEERGPSRKLHQLKDLFERIIKDFYSKGKYFVQPKYKEFPDKSFAEVSFFVIRELPSSQVEAAMPKFKLLLFSSLVELDHTLEITLL